MSSTAVTDLDYFVGLGHREEAVREALLITRGNRNAALYLLARKGDISVEKGQLAWRKEAADDWVEGPAKSTPNIAENRALHKSPIYVFVEDYYPGDNPNREYVFMMQITLKDGRQWKIGRTYSECASFYNSLPMGTCRAFKNSFPPISKYQFVFGGDLPKVKLDRRLAGLSEWMRELILNETCMSSSKVLDLLYDFIDADSNGGRLGQKKAAEGELATTTTSSPPALLNTTSPLLLETQDSTQVAAARRKSQYISQAPLLGPEQLPITMNQSLQLMPFKVSVKKLQCYHDLLAMKQSKQTKDVEDGHRSECDAEMVAALAASHAEALAREQFEAEIAPREEAVDTVGEQLDSAASPLHAPAEVTDDAWAAEEREEAVEGKGPSADSTVSQEPSAALAPTICLPPQLPADAQAHVPVSPPVRVLQRLQSVSFLNMSIDTVQLQKDMRRDRIVVHGKRLDGAHTHLDAVYALCQENILHIMSVSGKVFDLGSGTSHSPQSRPAVQREASTNPFDFSDEGESSRDTTPIANTHIKPAGPQCMLQADEELARALQRAEFDGTGDVSLPPPPVTSPKSPGSSTSRSQNAVFDKNKSISPPKALTPLRQDCESLSRIALNMLSRSESGFLSHASLHEIFDIENTIGAPDFIPYFFVPEATLSDPLQLNFSILEKGGAPQATRGKFAQPALAEEWCVECTGETSTVYRLLDATLLTPLLQIRVTYQVSLFGMPQYQLGTRGAQQVQVVRGLSVKEGKCHVLIDKITTTTSRDWSSSPQRM